MASNRTATILRLDDGREIAFAEIGDQNGTPVFAFHGTPGSQLLFRPLDDAARRLGVRLIAPDRPGYGRSDYVPQRRLLDWPRDVCAIADFLGLEKFGVFGVSGGGPHAAVCAHQLAARLLGAAIVCGIAETLGEEDSRGTALRQAFLEEGRRAPRTNARATAQDFALFTRPWGFRLEDIPIPVDVYCGELVAAGRS